MPSPKVKNRESVLSAIKEYDQLGRKVFLTKYGYGVAKEYFINYSGREYDSKAILGVAHGIENASSPLKSTDFSGGWIQVVSTLQQLGFQVGALPPEQQSPLILVQNEVFSSDEHFAWLDITGESYQFPNQYIKKIIEGRRFIYYRGKKRRSGPDATPEYFGFGVIGEVSLDPDSIGLEKTSQRWFCKIDNYVPFKSPVSFKNSFNQTLEPIPQGQLNYWRNGVRVISDDTYTNILNLAGLKDNNQSINVDQLNFPQIDLVQITPSKTESLMKIPKAKLSNANPTKSVPRSYRRSKFSKIIGDRAEELILKHLSDSLPPEEALTLRWIANEGFTPGWDIEYESETGKICVEVKGTQGKIFPSIEITANEWNAARENKSNYHLYLVTKCTSLTAEFEVIKDPYFLTEIKKMAVQPMSWLLTLDAG